MNLIPIGPPSLCRYRWPQNEYAWVPIHTRVANSSTLAATIFSSDRVYSLLAYTHLSSPRPLSPPTVKRSGRAPVHLGASLARPHSLKWDIPPTMYRYFSARLQSKLLMTASDLRVASLTILADSTSRREGNNASTSVPVITISSSWTFTSLFLLTSGTFRGALLVNSSCILRAHSFALKFGI